jgi:hypothetical protein
VTSRFLREYLRLTVAQQVAFKAAVRILVAGLKSGRLDPGLRLKGVHVRPGVWEITWEPDGRATFEYGPEVIPGEPHIIWRRIGSHDIFQDP